MLNEHLPQIACVVACLFAFCITLLIIPSIILVSYKKNLFDFVDARKVHTAVVPRLGGVAFVPVITITIALLYGLGSIFTDIETVARFNATKVSLCLCSIFILYIAGVSDDLVQLNYKVKFACQFICSAIVAAGGIYFNDFGGLFGIHAVPFYVGIPFTILFLMFVINAINLIDGIDGLASGLSIVACFILGSLFLYTRRPAYGVMAFTTLGTLAGFFCFNVFGSAEKKHKIFMGDGGSQVVGLIIGLLCVRLSMSFSNVVLPKNVLAISLSVIIVPCFDTFRVMFVRMYHGINPFKADKRHIHHKLLELGMSHRTSMVFIIMIDMFFILLNFTLSRELNINLILAIDIVLWIMLHLWLNYIIKRRRELGLTRHGSIQQSIDTYAEDD